MAREPARRQRRAHDRPGRADGVRPDTSAERVREPRAVSELGAGGQTWVHVEADPRQGRYESLSLAFDAAGRFLRVERKAID